MYLISDHNVSDLCGREEILDIGLDPSESGTRTACERNDLIIWDTNDDGNTRVCKRTEHRRIRIINLHVLDAKSLHQVCHHRRLRQVIRHTTVVHSDRSFHCMVCTNLLCYRRPSIQRIRKELTIFIIKSITKKKLTIFIRNWSQASNNMYIPTVQWKHTRRCQSTKPPMQFFSIKETSEYEEDPNVQQLPLLQLLLLAMSTTTSPAKQLYSRNLLLSEHKEFSQPTEFFKKNLSSTQSAGFLQNPSPWISCCCA